MEKNNIHRVKKIEKKNALESRTVGRMAKLVSNGHKEILENISYQLLKLKAISIFLSEQQTFSSKVLGVR